MISDLINAIVKIEGGDSPNSVNAKIIAQYGLYNPGHLMYAKQPGAVPVKIGNRTWAGFPTYQTGLDAIGRQINLDASRGHTLETFIGKYAPSNENNTNSYLAMVTNWLGLDKTARLSDIVGGNGTDTIIAQSVDDATKYLNDLVSMDGSMGDGNKTALLLVAVIGIAAVVALAS